MALILSVRGRASPHRCGALDQAHGDAVSLARAELVEELGIEADVVSPIGRLFEAPGFASQAFDIFLAQGLVFGEAHLEITEMDLVPRRVAIAHLAALVADGTIVDAPTVSAIALLALHGVLDIAGGQLGVCRPWRR